jgi:hypothetical protein
MFCFLLPLATELFRDGQGYQASKLVHASRWNHTKGPFERRVKLNTA